MTRVLTIVSSHTGAYKNAMSAFSEIHPKVQIDFFGIRGLLFRTRLINDTVAFVPPCRDYKDRAFVIQTNGSDRVDTTGYDPLVLVDHRDMPQTDSPKAGPYAPKSHFAQRASQLGTTDRLKTDHRHRNTDDGLAMLRALVEDHLTLSPPDTPQREDA